MTTEHTRTSTRDRILETAVAMARSGTKVTVRGVATGAGVGMGTLRHHFRTQRELLDAVVSSIYEGTAPDQRIHDASVPAEERLLECLRHLLTAVGNEQEARATWTDLLNTFIVDDAEEGARLGYIALHRRTLHRIELWLSVLVEEGSLDPADNTARAMFLLAVVNGLAVQRALPAETAPLEVEDVVLHAALASLSLR